MVYWYRLTEPWPEHDSSAAWFFMARRDTGGVVSTCGTPFHAMFFYSRLIMIYHGLSSLSWFIMIYHHFNRYFIIGILSSFSLAYYMGVASQKQTEGSSDAMRKTLRPILAMCTSTSRALEENHTLPLPLELSNLS